MAEIWTPRVGRTPGLVRPVRLDPAGVAGPRRGQARGSRWRRTSRGWYVPADGPPDCVEQRILEQAVRLSHPGSLTAWSALRWYGARYFDGTDPVARRPLPITFAFGCCWNIGKDDLIDVNRERLWPARFNEVDGVSCSIPERALFDELRRRTFRAAITAGDMTFAAGISSPAEFADFVEHHRNGWTGVPFVRRLIPWMRADSRSPRETWMRLVWELDAGLPSPRCNEPLFDLAGELLGVPDLFDPVAGVVGEYDGGHHEEDDQRGRDVDREERFRDHGLEYFTVVRAHRGRPQELARRMRAVHARASFLPPEHRAWTLDRPAWWLRRTA